MNDKYVGQPGGDVETIVGPSVKVEGDFVSEGNIIIEGQVTGKIKTSKQLRVEEGAKVLADVTADSAIVSGEIRGNMRLATNLELTPTAKVYGDVSTKTLIVSAGAILQGHTLMDESEKSKGKSGKKIESYDENSGEVV
ncbi:MAG TPA: polymer-forming cytoskeletal protein [Candidatus Magasanikbacteria bacterium]|nr:polymer-forming cytoskeletal protein [Candidatus Magasanikbacteria bacterium]